ncbi:oligoendopeptidase F [Deinococcus metallilatus]|uniref:M3 family oligoendopeptidase n=1 Tax=Deinococcus metallilatus TaxID=1211322 RepID=A0AAJ5F431_9DEIO|nr:M3 family oligoendopeptidase [Deinococcus metallilatus]MBB5297138.1 oligoendopeptidase F [Deinococcus metallilatus]QBY10076.1 oligoendopeptidase F [Deinococcus metallilatus]RXJ08331.1 oligoendopeptidase F [Deinococcus metallilatus]TLK21959.1 M3 family oligoendopeptidase [Deinococcus metallilatus]GMA17297.1 oligoendopeptidase F [Deinococcus metallilatus]
MTTTLNAVERVLSVPDEQTRWDTYAPRYAGLLSADLTAEQVPAWLAEWSALDAEVGQAGNKLATHADLHTDDEAIQARYAKFLEEVSPQAQRAEQALTEKLLAVPGYTPAPDFALNYRRFRDAAALFREANVELGVTHEAQMNRHGVITGNQKVILNGEERTVPQAKQQMDSPDRTEREEAWRALAASNQGVAPALDALMLELIGTRQQLAWNADLPGYRDFIWRRLDRVDYTPEDCRAFHEAVREEVVPLAAEIMGGIAARLGLDSVRPWDYNRNNLLDPEGRASLKPFKTGAELEDLAQTAFEGLDGELAARFRSMRDGLLDLQSRPGKMTHAYCQYFPVQNEPFVLMNVVGTSEDVRVLFHEVGHAFHGFLSGGAQPLVWNRWSPIEFVEIPSMAMEFLTLDHLGHVFSPAELARYREKQLQGVVAFLPWAAQMDAFQHWLYAEAGQNVTTADLDAKWLELDRTFHPFVNWDGLDESVRAKGWQYYHVFRAPFYYIEYAMCYLAAVGIWRGARQNPAEALSNYKASLRLGSTVPVPELYHAAGVDFRFDREHIRGLMAFLKEQLA